MNKKLVFIVITMLVFVGLFGSSLAMADAPDCYDSVMDLVTYDNGLGGLWAIDRFHRTVRVCDFGGGNFTLTFTDTGTFETLGGPSPGGTGTVDAGVMGTVTGYGALNITGVLADPFPTHVTHDFRGDNPRRYFDAFFSIITTAQYTNWGWTFVACGTSGTWVDNADTEGGIAPMGDITGAPQACPAGTVTLPPWPDDDRVDPDAASRLAIYCETDPVQIKVYGNNGNSEGFLLAVFDDLDAIVAAGPDGLYQPAETGEGIVSISVNEDMFFYFSYVGEATVEGERVSTAGVNNADWSDYFQCFN